MQTVITVFFILMLFVGLPVALFLLRDFVASKRAPSSKQQASEQAKWRNRLLNPNFSWMADYLRADIPTELIEMYSDTDLIQKTDFDVTDPANPDNSWPIAAFFPAHPAQYKDMWEATKYRFCIAESPFGDPFYVELETVGLPVYIYYHDGGDTEKVAPSLREFLSWIS